MNNILSEMKEICDIWVKMPGAVKSYTQNEIHLIYEYTTKLQKENKELKEELEKYNKIKEMFESGVVDLEELKNIILGDEENERK